MDQTCQFRLRAWLFTDQAGICGWSGEVMPPTLVKTSKDHIIPRSLGGPDDRWNYQLLHHGCNSSKGSRLAARAQDVADARGVRDGLWTLNLVSSDTSKASVEQYNWPVEPTDA